MYPQPKQPSNCLFPGVLGRRWRLTLNPRQSLYSVCLGLIARSRGPDGGGAKRREHGWPPLYQSESSSSTQTKLTCRCTGHVQAPCGNKSHWIRGRYLSAPLNVPSLPPLSPDAKTCLSLCGSLPCKQQTEQLTELYMQTIMERACISCTNAVAEFFLFYQTYIYFVANDWIPRHGHPLKYSQL